MNLVSEHSRMQEPHETVLCFPLITLLHEWRTMRGHSLFKTSCTPAILNKMLIENCSDQKSLDEFSLSSVYSLSSEHQHARLSRWTHQSLSPLNNIYFKVLSHAHKRALIHISVSSGNNLLKSFIFQVKLENLALFSL